MFALWFASFRVSIKAVRRFTMLEVFVRLFLTNLVLLTQRGLARRYQRVALPARAYPVSAAYS